VAFGVGKHTGNCGGKFFIANNPSSNSIAHTRYRAAVGSYDGRNSAGQSLQNHVAEGVGVRVEDELVFAAKVGNLNLNWLPFIHRRQSYSPSASRNWRDSLHASRSPPESGAAPINCTMPSSQLIVRGAEPLGHSSLSGRRSPFTSG